MRLLDDKQHHLLLIIEELKHPNYLILALTCISNIVGATLCSKQVNIKRKTDKHGEHGSGEGGKHVQQKHLSSSFHDYSNLVRVTVNYLPKISSLK